MGRLGTPGVIGKIFDEYGLGEEIVLFYEKEIIKAETDFLFVVPRKCLTEYKALVGEGSIGSVFSVRKSHSMENCEIRYGTPKSFILYVEEIKKMLDDEKDFVISVIDDIIMHGRGICLFLDRFLSCFSETDAIKVRKRIRVVAFVRNAEIPFLQKNYPDIYATIRTYRTYSEPSDLKRISDMFINSFAMTMTPNTSFVNSWIIKQDEREGSLYRWLKEKTVKGKEGIYQEYVSYLNEYKISVFECEKIEAFEDIVEFACIRCYTSNLSRITLIPYVFLKSLTAEEIDETYNELLRGSYAVLVKEFWDRTGDLKSEDVYMLKLEYLIRVISEIYGCYFLKEFQADQGEIKWSDCIEEDVDALKFSYLSTYYNVDDLFSAFEDYEYHGAGTAFYEDGKKYTVNEEESMQLFAGSSFYKQKADEKSFVDDYFSFNSYYDDKRALNGEERLKGITTGYLKKKLEEQKSVEELTFYGHLLCCMDSGKAALTISCVNNIYVSVLKGGEQAYRLLTEENQWVIKYLSEIEDRFIGLCSQDLIAEYMDKYICALYKEKCIDDGDSELLRYLSREVEDSRKDYFKTIASGGDGAKQQLRRRAYMRDYYVKRAEETPVPEYEEKLRKTYDRVMAYS